MTSDYEHLLCPACRFGLTNNLCTNRFCTENPDVPQDLKDKWIAENAERDAQGAERKRRFAIMSQSFTKRS